MKGNGGGGVKSFEQGMVHNSFIGTRRSRSLIAMRWKVKIIVSQTHPKNTNRKLRESNNPKVRKIIFKR